MGFVLVAGLADCLKAEGACMGGRVPLMTEARVAMGTDLVAGVVTSGDREGEDNSPLASAATAR